MQGRKYIDLVEISFSSFGDTQKAEFGNFMVPDLCAARLLCFLDL